MFGAIFGDILGSTYIKKENGAMEEDILSGLDDAHFSDATVTSIAISDALRVCQDIDTLKYVFTNSLKYWGRKYSDISYGRYFKRWLTTSFQGSYGSLGSGAAMRVSPIPYYFVQDLEKTRQVARISSEVTHGNLWTINGVEAVACTIWLALHGEKKKEMERFLASEFGFVFLDKGVGVEEEWCNELCLSTIPKAFLAFFNGHGFEEVMRNAIAWDGDIHAVATIAGSLAEAYYGMPIEIEEKCLHILDSILCRELLNFEDITKRAIWTDVKLRKTLT